MIKLGSSILIGLLFGIGVVPALAEGVGCKSPFTFDTKPTFNLRDISSLSRSGEPIYDGDVVFWVDPFDDEDQPQRDGRLAVAMVVAARAGIEEPLVGGVLWSTRFTKFNKDESDRMNKAELGEFAVFTLDDPKAACPNRDFVVHFDHKGTLWAGGKKVAQLPPDVAPESAGPTAVPSGTAPGPLPGLRP